MSGFLCANFDSKTNIWTGPRFPPSYNDNVSIGQLIFLNLTRHPKNIQQINDTEQTTLTNENVLDLSKRFALKYLDMGLKSKDVIGVIASNTTYLMPVLFASFFVNVPCHNLDVSFDKETVKHCWSKTRPKVIFCDGHVYSIVKEVVAELNLDCDIFTLNQHIRGVQSIEDLLSSVKSVDNFFLPLEIENGDQIAVILCSSGSTGLSKAVTISNKLCTQIFGHFFDTDQDIILTFSSLYWFSGLISILGSAITGATHLVISEPFNPEIALNLIEKYKVTKSFLSPSQIAMIVNSPDIDSRSLDSLKGITCGGSKLPVEIRSRFKQKLRPDCNIVFGYACTERGLISWDFLGNRVESTGTVFFNTEVKIIDENGNNLGSGEDGEIVVRSNNKWNGYYGDKHATDEVYDPESGWYKTGDKGHFDEDGYLYIVDRIKEILKSYSFHVAPTEIEEVILEIPEVADVCLIGIPDVIKFNLLMGLVVKKEGTTVTEDEIRKYVSDKLPYFKHLTAVYFVDSLPRTPSGKILRRKAKEIVEKLYFVNNLEL